LTGGREALDGPGRRPDQIKGKRPPEHLSEPPFRLFGGAVFRQSQSLSGGAIRAGYGTAIPMTAVRSVPDTEPHSDDGGPETTTDAVPRLHGGSLNPRPKAANWIHVV